jgi:hypothetical protein
LISQPQAISTIFGVFHCMTASSLARPRSATFPQSGDYRTFRLARTSYLVTAADQFKSYVLVDPISPNDAEPSLAIRHGLGFLSGASLRPAAAGRRHSR